MLYVALLGLLLFGLVCLQFFSLRRKVRRAESRYPPEGRFITVEGVRLHYRRQGSGPPVILLHGSDGFLQDFTWAALDPLAAEHDVVVFDRPGHGYSEAPSWEPPSPEVQARLIRGALQQMGVDQPLLVG